MEEALLVRKRPELHTTIDPDLTWDGAGGTLNRLGDSIGASGQDYRFHFEGGSEERTMLIDSGLEYATFLGGEAADVAYAVAVGPDGSTYLAGKTRSFGFPVTADLRARGLHSSAGVHHPGRLTYDGFVTRFDATGALVYSVLLGGLDDDLPWDIAVDETGSAYVIGSSRSPDFPVTTGAYAMAPSGEFDAFVCKLAPDGATLQYSILFGGTSEDYALGLDLALSGEVVVTGGTASADFPVTPGAWDTSFHDSHDAFIARFDPTGTTLLAATFLAGISYDDGWDVVLDAEGAVYVGGRSSSPDFPTTPGAFGTSWQGSFDAFIAKLSPLLDQLIQSNQIGGPRRDECHALSLDPSGAVVFTGVATSAQFPTTPGAYDTTQNGGYDAFVSKLSPTGDQLVYSTFIGGSDHDVAWDLALDPSGQACVAGITYSPDLPITIGCYDPAYADHGDAFVVELSPQGNQLVYASYLGKAGLDEARAMVLDANGAAHIAGTTSSRFFPTTEGAFDGSWSGDQDAFLVRLALRTSCLATSTSYGEGWPGTNGVPAFAVDLPPILCESTSITVGNSSGYDTGGVLLIGFAMLDQPTAWGGTLLVLPTLAIPFAVPPSGAMLPLDLPCDETLCGVPLFLQAIEFDDGASAGVAFTPGLELDLGGRQ